MVFERGLDILNIIFIGHYGSKVELAGISVGNILFLMLLMSVLMGVSQSTQGNVAKAFAQENYILCNDYLNKERIFTVLYFTVVAIVLYFSESYLTAFGIHPDVARETFVYVTTMIPA